MSLLKRLLTASKILFLLVFFLFSGCDSHSSNYLTADPNAYLKEAYAKKLSNFFIETEGHVVSILRDDTEGSRHQRFILRLSTGQTLLVSHNIDIAPKIINLTVGDMVKFRGEYIYNDKGGIVHWTHRDPLMKKEGGWIIYKGLKYN